MVATPLSIFMDEVSLCETARHRWLLRSKGLSLPTSHCTSNASDIKQMNWELLGGAKAKNVVAEYSSVLLSPPDNVITMPFNMSLSDYFGPVFETMCDTFYRLCLNSQRLQAQILEIHFKDVSEAAERLKEIAKLPKCCTGDSCTQAGLKIENMFLFEVTNYNNRQ